jgi:hypothetical protein
VSATDAAEWIADRVWPNQVNDLMFGLRVVVVNGDTPLIWHLRDYDGGISSTSNDDGLSFVLKLQSIVAN